LPLLLLIIIDIAIIIIAIRTLMPLLTLRHWLLRRLLFLPPLLRHYDIIDIIIGLFSPLPLIIDYWYAIIIAITDIIDIISHYLHINICWWYITFHYILITMKITLYYNYITTNSNKRNKQQQQNNKRNKQQNNNQLTRNNNQLT
jgi:hypothetical protein